ncbi:MAG: hypothetical protein J5802_13215 [Butyrivibrio sp.]|nr:hypothetical protein [Butyrivibrio sp.]
MKKRAIFLILLCIAAGVTAGCGADAGDGIIISADDSFEETEEEVEEETEESVEEASEEASDENSEENANISASDDSGVAYGAVDNNVSIASTGSSATNITAAKSATKNTTVVASKAETSAATVNGTSANIVPATSAGAAPANTAQANTATQNAAPARVLPAAPAVKDGVHIFTKKGVETCFEWNKPQNADYFQVLVEARPKGNSSFSTITKFTTNDLYYQFGDYQNYDVRIMVRACNGPCQEGAYGPWSQYAYGNTHDDILPYPDLSPGRITSHEGDSYTVSFAWAAVVGADHYKIDVETKPCDASTFSPVTTCYSDSPDYSYSLPENYDIRITVSARMNIYDDSGNRKIITGPTCSVCGSTYVD